MILTMQFICIDNVLVFMKELGEPTLTDFGLDK